MPPPLFTFECPDCQSKSEFKSLSDDITTTSVIVCPSCQALYDIADVDTENQTIHTAKSKFDKTNYRKKIAGITNQLDISKIIHRTHKYEVPCPHCKHIWEMKGVPMKSVHQWGKCYQYFGFDDVRTTISSTGSTSTRNFEVDFQVSAIYPSSIMNYDIDKLAESWRNRPRPEPEPEPTPELQEESSSVQPVN